jgi:hypothetical protein
MLILCTDFQPCRSPGTIEKVCGGGGGGWWWWWVVVVVGGGGGGW